MIPENHKDRLTYLDSARGIAALMVMFGHLFMWKYENNHIIHALCIIFNPNDAVSFFFVLSGMVLSYPYLQLNKTLDIGKFYVTRIFRIYPGFWVALLAGVLYAYRQRLDAAHLSAIFLENTEGFWQEFFLFKGHNVFYGAGWSLSVELVYSLLMPFLIAVARYNRKLVPWLIWISLATSSVTGLFLFHFALGLFIGAYFDRYNSEEIRQTFWYRYRVWLLILALPMFSMRYWTRIMPIGGYTLYDFLDYLKLDFAHLSALTSFIFIICLIHYGRLRRAFQAPFLVYIGKISYGIYLVHYVLVSAMGDYWESDILPLFPSAPVALAVSAVVCFALTILLASMIHYWVELPFIRLGKRVVKKMKPTIGI